ncbi:Uncharacterized protein ABC855_g4372 [[Candida] zeylanoides]
MAFLFKRNPKTPPDLVRALNEQLTKLDATADNRKHQDEAARHLAQIKLILHGDDDNDPQPDQISQLAQEVYATDTLYLLVACLRKLDFDSRKDVLILFSTLLRRQIGSQSPTVDYLLHSRPDTLLLLMRGPETPEIGLTAGQILRDCIKFESINRYILAQASFWNYFRYCQIEVFEIATDAFATLHDLLTLHKRIVSEFLAQNYDRFTLSINNLLRSPNYVTKRQSVRLLSELVLQRQNQYFLNRYFDDTGNLKLVMILLSDRSKNLQIEGFHIFKFFVAKPKKSQKVLEILIKNKENFLALFRNFDVAHANDANLVEERDYIIGEIQKLPAIEKAR